MGKLSKAVKTGFWAGVCGLGLCALEKRFKLTTKLANLARNIDLTPFPGTRLYEFLAPRELKSLYGEIADEILEGKRFGRILDLNAGPGHLPIEIASRDRSVGVVGLEQSVEMQRVAQANARGSGVHDAVEFAPGEPTNLPFPGRYFDLAVSVNLVHRRRNLLEAFDEVYHVLRPGGEFWIYDYSRDVPVETWQELQKGLPLSARPVFEIGPVASWQSAPTREELLDAVAKSNFTPPEIEPRTYRLFDRPMPVFIRVRLRKPKRVRESEYAGLPLERRQ